jgi:hypothetical protein
VHESEVDHEGPDVTIPNDYSIEDLGMHSRLQSLQSDMLAVGLENYDDRDAGPPGFMDSIDFDKGYTKDPTPVHKLNNSINLSDNK